MTDRALDNTNSTEAAASTPDIKVHGDPNAWECVCKASSTLQGWMKSTKRMHVPGGWLYQITTEIRHSMGVEVAEALAFVPDAGA